MMAVSVTMTGGRLFAMSALRVRVHGVVSGCTTCRVDDARSAALGTVRRIPFGVTLCVSLRIR